MSSCKDSRKLTPREREVLPLLTRGMHDSEIADSLCIAPRTAEHHVAEIKSKLGARTRGEAVFLALTEGLVSMGGPIPS